MVSLPELSTLSQQRLHYPLFFWQNHQAWNGGCSWEWQRRGQGLMPRFQPLPLQAHTSLWRDQDTGQILKFPLLQLVGWLIQLEASQINKQQAQAVAPPGRGLPLALDWSSCQACPRQSQPGLCTLPLTPGNSSSATNPLLRPSLPGLVLLSRLCPLDPEQPQRPLLGFRKPHNHVTLSYCLYRAIVI